MIRLLVLGVINLILKCLPFFIFRRFFLIILGHNIAKGVTIHRGLRLFGFQKIEVGRDSTINRNVYIDNRKSVVVGSNVSISHDCRIYTLGHDIDDPLFSAEGAPVRISDNVVLFAGSILMPGLVLEKGCVIYPFSVVVKNVGQYEVWGGNPAIKIRFRELGEVKYKAAYPKWLGN